MFFFLRGLPILLELGLLIYCVIDAIQTPEGQARNLPKWAWIVLIVLLPLVGGIAWLAAGRPVQAGSSWAGRGRTVPWPSGPTAGYPEYERPRRQLAPDDDESFLAGLRTVDDEHEQTLARWEEDLRRREQELRGNRPSGSDAGTPGSGSEGLSAGPEDPPPAAPAR